MSRPPLFFIPRLITCLLLLLLPPVSAIFPNISRVYGCYDLSDGSTVQCYSGQNVTILLTSYDRLQCTTNVTVRLGDRWNCLYPAANSLWGFSCMVPSLPLDALNQTLPVKVVCGNESTPWFMGLRSWGELAITPLRCAPQCGEQLSELHFPQSVDLRLCSADRVYRRMRGYGSLHVHVLPWDPAPVARC